MSALFSGADPGRCSTNAAALENEPLREKLTRLRSGSAAKFRGLSDGDE